MKGWRRAKITTHARERAAQRFGEAFDLEASLARARPMSGSEYKAEERRSRRNGGSTLPHRRHLFIDRRTRALFITKRADSGRRIVLTVVQAIGRPPRPVKGFWRRRPKHARAIGGMREV